MRSQLPFSSAAVMTLARSRFDCCKSKLVIAPFDGDLARPCAVSGYEMLLDKWCYMRLLAFFSPTSKRLQEA